MKTFKLSIALLLLLGALSCKKNESSKPAATIAITSDQAADLAAGSLATNSNGLADVTDNVTVNALALSSSIGAPAINSIGEKNLHQQCGTTKTDSVTETGTTAEVTYNYFVKYSRTLNCNANNQPDNIVTSITYHGSFDGPNVSSTNSGTSNFKIAGFTSTATDFVINGEYKRTGSFQSKVGNKASGNSSVDIVVTNLVIAKPSRKIVGGSATIAISGTSAKGVAFSYSGNIVFNGDGTATLTIDGTVYTIDLHTGIKTKH